MEFDELTNVQWRDAISDFNAWESPESIVFQRVLEYIKPEYSIDELIEIYEQAQGFSVAQGFPVGVYTKYLCCSVQIVATYNAFADIVRNVSKCRSDDGSEFGFGFDYEMKRLMGSVLFTFDLEDRTISQQLLGAAGVDYKSIFESNKQDTIAYVQTWTPIDFDPGDTVESAVYNFGISALITEDVFGTSDEVEARRRLLQRVKERNPNFVLKYLA